MTAYRLLVACLVWAAIVAVPLESQAAETKLGDKPRAHPDSMSLDGVAQWTSPRVDVERLLAEDEANRDVLGIPARIGFPMKTDLDPSKSGTWQDLDGGGQIWRLKVKTEGALWTVLGFGIYRLQPGGELRVYDENLDTVMGPYTAADVRNHGELWFPPIAGDLLVVELFWPEKLRRVFPDLALTTVSHGYKPFGTTGLDASRDFGDSGACNIDLACPLGADWQDEKRGAVMMLSGGSGFCSGSLINTTADDCRPYVLTAFHCGVSGPSATIGFNFERPGCNSGIPPSQIAQTMVGATLLAQFSGSDFALFRMDNPVPEAYGAYFNGWSAINVASAASWGIHYPRGDAKKICHNADPLIPGLNFGANHWRITEWEEGTTEPASSGSPLFDTNSRIIGQLHGGTASCTSITWDEYGGIWDSYDRTGSTPLNRLRDWLDPAGTGQLTMDGVDHQTCIFSPAGSIELDAEVYACGATIGILVRDDSLQGQQGLTVTVASNTETTPETVTLTAETPGSGRFSGTFNTTPGTAINGDSLLGVLHGDTITAVYIDADDGAGGTNIPRQDLAAVDCNKPVISNVMVTEVTGFSARVQWATDEPADSTVRVGLTPPPISPTSDAALVVSHDVKAVGLGECTPYVFSVESTDAVGNGAEDNNGGAYYNFETGKNTMPSIDSTDTPVAIPDNAPAGAGSTINVADDKTVLDVNVTVNITHTFDGDLALSLIPPVGAPISLSNRRGSSGDNFVGTLFDDEAATPIALGAAPFTGAFQPDSPLSAADGISSLGNWQLLVVDNAGADIGTIDSWNLTLTFPALACGPHAGFRSQSLIGDACSTGGGGGNGIWEAGETVQFQVEVANDGTDPLTGVSVQVVPTTAGVVMLDGTATVGAIAEAASGVTAAPHVTAFLPAGASCGGTVSFDVIITANEGTYGGSFDQGVGLVIPGGGIAFSEDFETGTIPVGWTIVDGLIDGNTWYADNATDPALCGNTDPLPPLTGTWAAVDSDCAGLGVSMDEELISPVIDLTPATLGATLDFDHFFRWFSGGQNEQADVDVRSSLTAGAWVNVANFSGASTPNPDHATIDISAQAAGASDVQIRFHYYNAVFEWTWFLDNLTITFQTEASCSMTACPPGPPGPPSVPGLVVDRLTADGSSLSVDWDDQCLPASAKIVYGPLNSVSTYTVSGASCAIADPATWNGVPLGSLWFVVVGEDGGVESSWGLSSGNAERNGLTPSGTCSAVSKDIAGTCP